MSAEPRKQDDVEIVSHYASQDELDCVQALLLLAGVEPHVEPSKSAITPQRRRPDAPAA